MSNNTVVATIHAPNIEPRHRHPRIFETFDELQSGEWLQLTNDHDPRPLHYQFLMEREGLFVWETLEAGPDVWKVNIGKK